jgi:hypothetical protein
MEGPLRFAELRRKLGVTEKVLTHQLRELESHGVVGRKGGRSPATLPRGSPIRSLSTAGLFARSSFAWGPGENWHLGGARPGLR